MRYFYFLFVMLALFATSCDVPDFSNAKYELDPIQVAAPIGSFTFDNLEDVVSLEKFSSNFQDISLNSGTSGVISPADQTIDLAAQNEKISLNLSPEPGFSISEVQLYAGDLQLKFAYSFNSDVKLKVEIPELVNPQGAGFVADINLSKANTIYSTAFNLAGYKLAPSASGEITVKTSGAIYVKTGESLGSASVTPSIELNNLKFNTIQGNFGQKTVTVDPETLDLKDMQNENVKLGNGRVVLKMEISNEFGIPFGIDLNQIKAIKKDQSVVKLNYTGPTLVSPAQMIAGEIKAKKTPFELNAQNSNIDKLFSADVEKIVFGLGVSCNPAGAPSPLNFVSKSSKIQIKLAVQAPIQIQID